MSKLIVASLTAAALVAAALIVGAGAALAVLGLLLLAGLTLAPRTALAWDDSRVHPWLTGQAMKLLKDQKYAAFYELAFIAEDVKEDTSLLNRIPTAIGLPGTSEMAGNHPVIYGSIMEDDPATNGMYHFYNPKAQIHDEPKTWGLGLHSGWKTPDAGGTIGGAAKLLWNMVGSWAYEFPTTPFNAIERATRDDVGGDGEDTHHTWHWAVDWYKRGDWDRAYAVLGRVVHLLEDMAVPAHVRNDNHLGQYLANFVDSPWEVANGLLFGKSRYEGFFPIATHDMLKRGMEPFECYTYGLVLKGEAPATGDRPVFFAEWDAYFRDLAMYTHTHWYSENTIPGNDSAPGRCVDESDVPDPNKCHPIDVPLLEAAEGTPDDGGTTFRDVLGQIIPTLISPKAGIAKMVLGYYWKHGQLRRRFVNYFNSEDYRAPDTVGRPYTLAKHNHLAAARDLMPRAIRYAAGLIEKFYEDQERLSAELERGEKTEPWGTPIEFKLEVKNKGALLENLEVRLDGMDGIADVTGGQPDWRLELLVADDQEEPHTAAKVAEVDPKRHIWRVAYSLNGPQRLQQAESQGDFDPPPLQLILRATPPGVRTASGGAR